MHGRRTAAGRSMEWKFAGVPDCYSDTRISSLALRERLESGFGAPARTLRGGTTGRTAHIPGYDGGRRSVGAPVQPRADKVTAVCASMLVACQLLRASAAGAPCHWAGRGYSAHAVCNGAGLGSL